MILNQQTFDQVRNILNEGGYPTKLLAYSGAEEIRDGNQKRVVVWFTCRDRRISPRRGQIVAFTEDFRIAYVKPLKTTVSVGEKLFEVVCSKGGRTITRLNIGDCS